MRPAPLALALLTTFALVARAAVPFPDTTTGEFTALDELRTRWDRDAATILLFERTDKAAEATRLHTTLWAAREHELTTRRLRAADLSLATVNPWLTAEERTAAHAALERVAADLAELSTFAMPDPATRDQFLARAGRPVTDVDHTRAKLHLLLQKMRNGTQLAQLQNRSLFERRRAVVEKLEALAASRQPLASAVIDAKDLPLAAEAVRSLADNFAEAGPVQMFAASTGDSSVLAATLTRLLLSHPASASLWTARARARWLQGWREGATRDLSIALHLDPKFPAAAALQAEIAATPALPASVWQEYVDASALRATTGQKLPPELEPSARAALRNRARRLYTCSFIFDATERAAALRWVQEQNPAQPSLAPALAPAIGAQFPQDLAAAGNDVRALLAVHHRYATLFAGTEVFWHAHITLLARAGQWPAALAALDVAAVVAPQATWIGEFRPQIEQRLRAAAPAAAK